MNLCDGCLKTLRDSYSKEVKDGILQFMEDIIDKKIQIRVHKTKKLHAKIYVFLPKTLKNEAHKCGGCFQKIIGTNKVLRRFHPMFL